MTAGRMRKNGCERRVRPFASQRPARLALLLALAVPLAAAALPIAPTPLPTREPPVARPRRAAKPPLDFSGVWQLDPKASAGVSPAMEGAILSVHQAGNRIRIEPLGEKRHRMLAEDIVADGRPYEKWLGTDRKGSVTVAWGKDRKSLWIEVLGGPTENPRQSVQRSVWKLAEDGKVWVRQSVTIQGGQTFQVRLVFRKRPS